MDSYPGDSDLVNHMQERLEREFHLSLIMTAPTVVYRCTRTNGETEEVSNPATLPDVSVRKSISEPIVKMELITPAEYNGPLMELCQQRRGEFCSAVEAMYSTPLLLTPNTVLAQRRCTKIITMRVLIRRLSVSKFAIKHFSDPMPCKCCLVRSVQCLG
jgi:hypothetical protein